MDTQIISAIWHHTQAPTTMRYGGTIDRNHHDFFTEHRNPLAFEQDPGKDVFFAPLAFDGARKNENARALKVLFADLDNVWTLTDQLHKFWPHALWLTSQENAQAVWFLDAEMPTLNAWSDLNQRMTYFMGADRGGWHASKLLRVPGSHNYKYDPPQRGKVWSFQPKATPYEAEALHDSLPPVKTPDFHRVSPVPTPIPRDEWKAHLASLWHRLPLRTRTDLLEAGMPDRSVALVRASNKMRGVGISPEDQFQALWWVAWNKFRTDRNRPDLLWEIVTYEG